MFEEMNTIVLSGKEYPMKCDNLVLEKIQDKYEDLGKYENMLNGFVPELDEYGEEVRNEDGLLVGHYKMPDIKIINEAAVWFIQEGLAIKREENKEEIPEISDRTLIRQIDFNPRELSTILHQEFSRCFERKNATTTQGKAESQNRYTLRGWYLLGCGLDIRKKRLHICISVNGAIFLKNSRKCIILR